MKLDGSAFAALLTIARIDNDIWKRVEPNCEQFVVYLYDVSKTL